MATSNPLNIYAWNWKREIKKTAGVFIRLNRLWQKSYLCDALRLKFHSLWKNNHALLILNTMVFYFVQQNNLNRRGVWDVLRVIGAWHFFLTFSERQTWGCAEVLLGQYRVRHHQALKNCHGSEPGELWWKPGGEGGRKETKLESLQ